MNHNEYNGGALSVLSNLPVAIPTTGGEYIVSQIQSETIKFDIVAAQLNDIEVLETKCKLFNISVPGPEEWKSSDIFNLIVLEYLINTGNAMSRLILEKFPDNPPNEYYDFTIEENDKDTFCSDDGRLLWKIITEKWDCKFICISKNRYVNR